MILFLLSVFPSFAPQCVEPEPIQPPSLDEVHVTRYANIEEQLTDGCEDAPVALSTRGGGEPLPLSANLNHLHGDLTRRLTGAAAFFG